jgi:hypothetical protein
MSYHNITRRLMLEDLDLNQAVLLNFLTFIYQGLEVSSVCLSLTYVAKGSVITSN